MPRTPPPEDFVPDDGMLHIHYNFNPEKYKIEKVVRTKFNSILLFFLEPSLATSTESESPRPESYTKNTKFRYVNSRDSSRNRHSPENSPRRSSVPNFVPGQVAHNHNQRNLSPAVCVSSRSRSPEYLSSRQSSLSDDSSGPYSGRSTETQRSSQLDSGYNSQPASHTRFVKYFKKFQKL